jgi:pimeloyl-ACP methyl ester carboxylesterase
MRNTRIRHVVVFFLVVAALFTGTTYVYAATGPTGRQLADSAIAALKASAPASTSKNVLLTLSWSWLEMSFKDEKYPLKVDFVGSNFQRPDKGIIYMLPGGGVNFSSSYFTPLDNNLAQFFRKAGYLVVGITPREDSVPSGIKDYSFMVNWGMDKHKKDIKKIIGIIQAKANNRPYRVLGHSFGAAYALDYAAMCKDTDPSFKKVIALDIYSFDKLSDEAGYAAGSYGNFLGKPGYGLYADASYTDMKSLMLISLLLPKIDSGVSQGEGLGNFTFEGMLYFSLIDSAYSGIQETDWPLVLSYAAGDYTFSGSPLYDSYHLSKSDINTVRAASFKVGSGLVPYALYRDWFAVNSYNTCDTYRINWSKIKVPAVWLNTELGYGENMDGADLIPPSVSVTTDVIPGYGHLDILLSRTAQDDGWKKYNLDK